MFLLPSNLWALLRSIYSFYKHHEVLCQLCFPCFAQKIFALSLIRSGLKIVMIFVHCSTDWSVFWISMSHNAKHTVFGFLWTLLSRERPRLPCSLYLLQIIEQWIGKSWSLLNRVSGIVNILGCRKVRYISWVVSSHLKYEKMEIKEVVWLVHGYTLVKGPHHLNFLLIPYLVLFLLPYAVFLT